MQGSGKSPSAYGAQDTDPSLSKLITGSILIYLILVLIRLSRVGSHPDALPAFFLQLNVQPGHVQEGGLPGAAGGPYAATPSL